VRRYKAYGPRGHSKYLRRHESERRGKISVAVVKRGMRRHRYQRIEETVTELLRRSTCKEVESLKRGTREI
jgi:hypothetical protein